MSEFTHEAASKLSLAQRRLIYGVGINDANYKVNVMIDGGQAWCPFYRRWKGMLERCYSESYQLKHPTYRGLTVCDKWLYFSVFRSWMAKQDWKDKQLDKDIKVKGSKVYSPDTCLFVTHHINKLLNDNGAIRGKHPKGVNFHKPTNKYQARVKSNGKQKYIGVYETPELAHSAYIKAKNAEIRRQAILNPDIGEYLLQHLEGNGDE